MKTKSLFLCMFFWALAVTAQATTVGQVGSLQSSDHTVNVASNDKAVSVTWTAASVTDSSLNGYATAWDHVSNTNPVTKTLSSSATSVDSPALSDATDWYFHIRAIADDGTYGTTSHLGPFVINTVPGISAVTPATGSAGSTTNITITGTNFVNGATVKVGTTSAGNVLVVSQTQITAVVPADMTAGTYSVKVTNPDGQVATKTAAFTVSVQNTAPIARAGEDQTADLGLLVSLNGSASSDADGDPLTYAWSQTVGAGQNLSGDTSSSPTFTPSAVGTYTFQLIVNDGTADSNPDTVSVTAQTTISGQVTTSGSGLSGVTVALSGSESDSTTTDTNGDYTFTVSSAGSYTLTPTKSGYSISAATVSVSAAAVVQDFTATVQSSNVYIPPSSNDTSDQNDEETDNTGDEAAENTGVTLASGETLSVSSDETLTGMENAGTVDNSGTLVDPNNSGTINGGTVSGSVTNTGTLNGVTLAAGTTVTGGTVSGDLAGAGNGATVTGAVLDVTSITNVSIGTGCKVTQATVTNNAGLDLTAAITGTDGIIDPESALLVDASGNDLSVNDLVTDAAGDLLQDASVAVSTNAATRAMSISAQGLGDATVPARVMSVVTTSAADGVSMTPSGELVFNANGISTTLAPASADLPSFESALQEMSLDGDIQDDGIIIIDLSGSRLALRFDIIALGAASTASLASASATFSLVGDTENPETFVLQVTYPDGTMQNLPPFVHDLDQFKQFMDAGSINYRIFPSSGVIELLDADSEVVWRGIPGYALLDAGAEASGITFEAAGDLNGDNLPDFYMITAAAKQILYTLP